MNRENRPQITWGPVEAHDFRKTADRFWRICGIYLKFVKKNRKNTTCNRLDLETTRISTDYAQKRPRIQSLERERWTWVPPTSWISVWRSRMHVQMAGFDWPSGRVSYNTSGPKHAWKPRPATTPPNGTVSGISTPPVWPRHPFIRPGFHVLLPLPNQRKFRVYTPPGKLAYNGHSKLQGRCLFLSFGADMCVQLVCPTLIYCHLTLFLNVFLNHRNKMEDYSITVVVVPVVFCYTILIHGILHG